MVGFWTRIGTNEKRKCFMFKIHSASSSLFPFHEISSCEIKISLVANCMILYLRKHSPKFGGGKKSYKNHTKSPDSYIWFK
jgi:hypothetical protein